ncbi:MAG: glycosyltransferase family 2 protein [Clostridiales bacterium]|nr:glycosyltransferase family 2 protein [Clostridiales bacterium]
MSLYSVVVPVFNSEHMLRELYTRIRKVFEEEIREDFELILVDDNSKDDSFSVMKALRKEDPRVKIIQMARNFGQHPALLCGFSYAKGDFIITMDDDLQHPPEEIPRLINTIKQRDDVDVIIAKYENRKHGLIRRIGTRLSVYATSKMLGKDPDLEITSFRLMRRFIVEAILQTNTHAPQIGNLLVLTSGRIINVPVRHDARAYGKSGYSFRRLVRDLLFDITSHTDFPLMVVRRIGTLSFLFSIILSFYYLFRYFAFGVSVEGFTTLVLLQLAFGGLILLSLGIIGTYLMNILNESKKMPHYVVRQKDVDDAPDGREQ